MASLLRLLLPGEALTYSYTTEEDGLELRHY
ncbi:hypothetical protein PAYE108092_07900 [Paracoccus yeei]|jgi:hypothetical protein